MPDGPRQTAAWYNYRSTRTPRGRYLCNNSYTGTSNIASKVTKSCVASCIRLRDPGRNPAFPESRMLSIELHSLFLFFITTLRDKLLWLFCIQTCCGLQCNCPLQGFNDLLYRAPQMQCWICILAVLEYAHSFYLSVFHIDLMYICSCLVQPCCVWSR